MAHTFTPREYLILLHWYYPIRYMHMQTLTNIEYQEFPNRQLQRRRNLIVPQCIETAWENIRSYTKEAVTYLDADYPEALRRLDDPPLVLYCRGQKIRDILSMIAVVGTRRLTRFGAETCRHFIEAITSRGFGTVSGLAKGIDTIVHEETIKNNQPTIAVLGSGFRKIYPDDNKTLSESIANGGGCLISEHPPHSPPRKENFPKRNRIIAALGAGTVVIEGSPKSGAAITGKLTLQDSKTCVVFTRDFNTDLGKGAIRLIEAGATPVTGVQEALAAISLPHGGKLKPMRTSPLKLPNRTRFEFNELIDANMSQNSTCSLNEGELIAQLQGLIENEKIVAKGRYFQKQEF